jgi:hypothetical protein
VKNGLAGAFSSYMPEKSVCRRAEILAEAICRSISWVSRKDVGSIVEKIGKLARERGTQK